MIPKGLKHPGGGIRQAGADLSHELVYVTEDDIVTRVGMRESGARYWFERLQVTHANRIVAAAVYANGSKQSLLYWNSGIGDTYLRNAELLLRDHEKSVTIPFARWAPPA